jgi:hypothetical protein
LPKPDPEPPPQMGMARLAQRLGKRRPRDAAQRISTLPKRTTTDRESAFFSELLEHLPKSAAP